MSFITNKVISSDERLVAFATLHWIYIAIGALWAGVILSVRLLIYDLFEEFLGTASSFNDPYIVGGRSLGSPVFWLDQFFYITAFTLFFVHLIKVLMTEIALTSERIIHKHGWLFIDVEEIDLSEISAEHVHHGFFGGILGYGSMHLDCRFVGDVYLPAIRKPHKFLRAVHKTRSDVEIVSIKHTKKSHK